MSTTPVTTWRTLPVLRIFAWWGPDRTLRIVASIALLFALLWVALILAPWANDPAIWIRDTSNYYAAGERLNASHSLYAYSPGDRHVLDLLFGLPSPYLYPPLIGVLWRPVAAFLPFEPVILVWWAAGMVIFLGMVAWLLWKGGRVSATGVLLLLVPIAWTAWSGNVSTFIAVAIVGAWFLLQRGHDRVAGALIGFTTVLKLSPAFLGWYLLVERRWPALWAAALTVGVSLLVSIAGAGLGPHFEFLGVSSAAARGGGIPASLVGILTTLGASRELMPLVAPIVSVVGIAVVYVLRDRPRAAWAAAVATGALASPIFNLTNVTVLLACFVPFDDRLDQAGRSPT
jgi:hypothetical protein